MAIFSQNTRCINMIPQIVRKKVAKYVIAKVKILRLRFISTQTSQPHLSKKATDVVFNILLAFDLFSSLQPTFTLYIRSSANCSVFFLFSDYHLGLGINQKYKYFYNVFLTHNLNFLHLRAIL